MKEIVRLGRAPADPSGIGGYRQEHGRSSWNEGIRVDSLALLASDPTDFQANLGKKFMIVQDEMTQHMHIIEGSYSPTERVTFLVGIPFITQTTAHQRVPGPNPFRPEYFDITTSGLSDVTAKAAYTLLQRERSRIITFGGISFPTGSIDERDDVPAGANRILPYTMQLGSGTYDLDPGIAYSARAGKWSWGAEFMYKVRLDENDAGYNFGNRCSTTVHLTHQFRDWVAPSVVLTGRGWNRISGRDSRLDAVAKAVPVANPDLYGGERLDLLFRLNLAVPRGPLKGNRLAIDGGFPLYQKLNGPQIRADFRLGVSWQWRF